MRVDILAKILLMLCIMLCLGMSVNAKTKTETKTVLVIGDSLSAGHGFDLKRGWVSLLAQRLIQRQKNYRVVNASVSGDTSGNGLARLPDLLTTVKPSVVIIALGGNDGLRGFPINEIDKNLSTMISQAQRAGARVLLIGVRLPPNYGSEYTMQFSNMYENLAKTYRVAFVPRLLAGVAGDRQNGLMQQDGIHPTVSAQPRLLETVWNVLARLLGFVTDSKAPKGE